MGFHQRKIISPGAHLDNPLLAPIAEELAGASKTPYRDITLLQFPRVSLTWMLGTTPVAAQQLHPTCGLIADQVAADCAVPLCCL